MTLVELSGASEEALSRDLVVLDPGFILARYDRESFKSIAYRRRQVSFGVALAVHESAYNIPIVKEAASREDSTIILLKSTPKKYWMVTPYTDVLPLHVGFYLEPGVPESYAPSIWRLKEVAASAADRLRYGLRIPPGMRMELEELNHAWSRCRIFRRLISRPGALRLELPSPEGFRSVTVEVRGGGASVSRFIREVHKHLSRTMGVIMSHENAARLRDAVVAARADGYGEADLTARVAVLRVDGGFRIEPYRGRVGSRVGEAQDHLDHLAKATGGSFSAELVDVVDKYLVVVEGLLRVRAAYQVNSGP